MGFRCFCFRFRWQIPRGPPRARFFYVSRGRKSNQFSFGAESEMFSIQDASHGCRSSNPLFWAWFLHRSFSFRAKPEEGDLFWIYVLDSERVFACVTQSSCTWGGLTGFWFKLLMNDGRLGFPFSSGLFLRYKNQTKKPRQGDREEAKMEGVRNNFSYAWSCWTSFQKMGVRKLKICKFSLVSKICCFFGSLSCVFQCRWFDVWNVVARGGTVFLLDQKLDGFRCQSGRWLVTSLLNLERFVFGFWLWLRFWRDRVASLWQSI